MGDQNTILSLLDASACPILHSGVIDGGNTTVQLCKQWVWDTARTQLSHHIINEVSPNRELLDRLCEARPSEAHAPGNRICDGYW